MTPEVTLADHNARIEDLEERVKAIERKIDWIFVSVIAGLGTTVLHLILHLKGF